MAITDRGGVCVFHGDHRQALTAQIGEQLKEVKPGSPTKTSSASIIGPSGSADPVLVSTAHGLQSGKENNLTNVPQTTIATVAVTDEKGCVTGVTLAEAVLDPITDLAVLEPKDSSVLEERIDSLRLGAPASPHNFAGGDNPYTIHNPFTGGRFSSNLTAKASDSPADKGSFAMHNPGGVSFGASGSGVTLGNSDVLAGVLRAKEEGSSNGNLHATDLSSQRNWQSLERLFGKLGRHIDAYA